MFFKSLKIIKQSAVFMTQDLLFPKMRCIEFGALFCHSKSVRPNRAQDLVPVSHADKGLSCTSHGTRAPPAPLPPPMTASGPRAHCLARSRLGTGRGRLQ